MGQMNSLGSVIGNVGLCAKGWGWNLFHIFTLVICLSHAGCLWKWRELPGVLTGPTLMSEPGPSVSLSSLEIHFYLWCFLCVCADICRSACLDCDCVSICLCKPLCRVCVFLCAPHLQRYQHNLISTGPDGLFWDMLKFLQGRALDNKYMWPLSHSKLADYQACPVISWSFHIHFSQAEILLNCEYCSPQWDKKEIFHETSAFLLLKTILHKWKGYILVPRFLPWQRNVMWWKIRCRG